jgi:hypothetical protein
MKTCKQVRSRWVHDGAHCFHRHERGDVLRVIHLLGGSKQLLYRWEVRTVAGRLLRLGHTRTGRDGQGRQVYLAAMEAATGWYRQKARV